MVSAQYLLSLSSQIMVEPQSRQRFHDSEIVTLTIDAGLPNRHDRKNPLFGNPTQFLLLSGNLGIVFSAAHADDHTPTTLFRSSSSSELSSSLEAGSYHMKYKR